MQQVGVDYWPATTHAPGVGRYVRELVRALVRLPEAPPLALLDVGAGPRAMEGAPLGLEQALRAPHRLRLPLPRRALDLSAAAGVDATRWLGGCALFHRAFPASPRVRARVPQVLPIAELPLPGSPAERALREALRSIEAVITFSAAGRGRVLERFGLDAARVHALPVGCDHWLRALPDEPALADPPRVLVLGRLDRRRGGRALAGACALLRERGIDLELCFAGRRGDAPPPAGAGVRWIESPREEALPALVAGSTVLAHLTDDALTPVTPLEAMACGASVLCTRLPAFEEALGALAEYVEPGEDDPARLAEALAAALARGRDAAGRADRRARARAYSWERHARATVGVWSPILRRALDRP